MLVRKTQEFMLQLIHSLAPCGGSPEPGARAVGRLAGWGWRELDGLIARVACPIAIGVGQQPPEQLHALVELDYSQGIREISLEALRGAHAKNAVAVQRSTARCSLPQKCLGLTERTGVARVHVELAARTAFLDQQLAPFQTFTE